MNHHTGTVKVCLIVVLLSQPWLPVYSTKYQQHTITLLVSDTIVCVL